MANILVVDDDKIVLKIVAAALREAGHTVTTVETGHDALYQLKAEKFALLIVDANMPGGVSGFSVVETTRRNEESENIPKLPVMFLTGRRDKSDVARAMKAGVDDYMVKPVDFDMLLAKVESLLEGAGKHEFTKTTADFKAKWSTEFEVVGVSEQGLNFSSVVPLPVNYKMKVDCDIFEAMGIPVPLLRIAECLKSKEEKNAYSMKAHFIGLSESEYQKIRRWVIANSPRKSSGAA